MLHIYFIGSMCLLGHFGVELFVPHAHERTRDVEALSIQTQLQHLRPARHALALHEERVRRYLPTDTRSASRAQTGDNMTYDTTAAIRVLANTDANE